MSTYKNRVIRHPEHFEVEVTNIHQPHPSRFICSLEDEPLLFHKWRLSNDGYIVATMNGKNHRFHRLVISSRLPGTTVDHIDRDRLNNTRPNLRLISSVIQAQNKLEKTKKELPPGIHRESVFSDDYVVTWTTDGEQTTLNFPATHYGRNGALKAAMRTRMRQMLLDETYIQSLFPINVVARALEEAGAPSLPSDASAIIIRIALNTLAELNYNLWQIPYDGRFAKIMDREDWSISDTKKYVLQTLMETIDHVENTLERDELKTECLALECDMRAIKYLYTTARRKKKDRKKEMAPVLIQHFNSLDTALTKLRSDAMPSSKMRVVQEKKTVPEAIQKAQEIERNREEIMIAAKGNDHTEMGEMQKSVLKERALKEKTALAKEEVGETTATVVEKAIRLASDGRESEVQAAMQCALKRLTKVETPSIPKSKRVYNVSDHAKKWLDQHLLHNPGSIVLASSVLESFRIWALHNGMHNPDGSQKLSQAIQNMGYEYGKKKVYFDTALVM